MTTRTKARLMLALVRQLQVLWDTIVAYDQEIACLFRQHKDSRLFKTLPRAGKRLAPRLLAEWGDDRTRYRDCRSIQALAGTAPVPYESGRYARPRQRQACVKPFRNALYQFAWQSVAEEPWAHQYYHRKRAEGKSHSMAVRALANIWVRIVYAMWTRQTPYDPTIFVAAQQRHQVQRP